MVAARRPRSASLTLGGPATSPKTQGLAADIDGAVGVAGCQTETGRCFGNRLFEKRAVDPHDADAVVDIRAGCGEQIAAALVHDLDA
jgi:hypothetical protein